MSQTLRLALALALAVLACAALAGPAAASSGSAGAFELGAAQDAATALVTSEQRAKKPQWPEPIARAACPFCVFAAVTAVRAAIAIRAAAAARAVVVAAAAARASARNLARVTKAKVRRVQADARKVSKRGKRWLKRNWKSLKIDTQACLATVAFMESKDFLADHVLTQDEWSLYANWGPRLVPATETLAMNFPIRFNAREIGSQAVDEAIECAIGMGATRWFSKRADDRPRPE